jgi:hypothetical protein
LLGVALAVQLSYEGNKGSLNMTDTQRVLILASLGFGFVGMVGFFQLVSAVF